MNFGFIFVLVIFRTIEAVLSIGGGFECVKRKSGACKPFDITEEFDHFIDLHEYDYGTRKRISTIIEIDYMTNKHSHEQNLTKTELDTVDNPVVEILFAEDKKFLFFYRLVLGEKFNRLAYVEKVEYERFIKYNNYSPDLPSWPFAINVTIDRWGDFKTKLSVYTRNDDGLDEMTPFLRGSSDFIRVQYMSIRNRNKNVKLVGFYDCSTKYGTNCGTERTQTITDCRQKFSPLGGGLFKKFVDMSKFNRLWSNASENKMLEFDEVFGIYRRNDDYIHILFSTVEYEVGVFVQITIGHEIIVRVRYFDDNKDDHYEKVAVKKGWNQEPLEPNFIQVKMSSVFKNISIYNLDGIDRALIEPMLTMTLCDYFDNNTTAKYMSVTSDRFNTVDLYYDCCLPDELDNCHVYEKRNYTMDTNDTDDTTIRNDAMEPTETTMESSEVDDTTIRNDAMERWTTMESSEVDEDETDTSTPNENDETMESSETDEDNYIKDGDWNNDWDVDWDIIVELPNVNKTRTFLDTAEFHKASNITLYTYENGTSMTDYCPHEIADMLN